MSNHHNPSLQDDYDYFLRRVEGFASALTWSRAVLIYLGKNLSASEVQSVECSFCKKKCKVLMFKVCYAGSAVLPHFGLHWVGEAMSVVRFFAY